jgi:hypothetical protein
VDPSQDYDGPGLCDAGAGKSVGCVFISIDILCTIGIVDVDILFRLEKLVEARVAFPSPICRASPVIFDSRISLLMQLIQ